MNSTYTTLKELVKSNRLREAKELLRDIKNDTKDPIVAFSLGLVAAKIDENYAEAERCFRLAIGADPSNCDYYWNLGLALERQGKKTEASKVFMTVSRLDPGDKEASKKVKKYETLNSEPTPNKQDKFRTTVIDIPNGEEQFKDYEKRLKRKTQIDRKIEMWSGQPVVVRLIWVIISIGFLIGLIAWLIAFSRH